MHKLFLLVLLPLLFPLPASAQIVPQTLPDGWVTFAIPLPEGNGIGWNFSLYGGDGSSDPNKFSYAEGTFKLFSNFPLDHPQITVTFTGTPGIPIVEPADKFGCYYVRFRVSTGMLTVAALDGTILKQTANGPADYWQEFCSLYGGGNNFWAAGGLTVLSPQ
jgi:hypothetical protein